MRSEIQVSIETMEVCHLISKIRHRTFSKTPQHSSLCGVPQASLPERQHQNTGKSVSLPGNPSGSSLLFDAIISHSNSSRSVLSCNGLLVWSRRSKGEVVFVVCNPTTKDCRLLPVQPESNKGSFEGVALAFDPSKSHHYKVLAIRYPVSDAECVELHVYSSEINRWELVRYIGRTTMAELHPGMFLNDIVYWLGLNQMSYYNLNSNEFGSVNISEDTSLVMYLAESCGYLYIVRPLPRCYKGMTFLYISEFGTSKMHWSRGYMEEFDTSSKVQRCFPNEVVSSDTTLDILSLRDALAVQQRIVEYIPSLAPV